ncbi:MAG: hypothetical protein K0V04_04695 [Deltaproteobacteria bacterium]|nr:hypothetical protein [Deltaproteobacteria bacterium]
MPTDPNPSEPSSGGWDFEWLESSRWIAQAYPSVATRHQRIVDGISAGWSDEQRTALEHAARDLLRAEPDPGGLAGVQAYVAQLRRDTPAPQLTALDFALTMLDAADRLMSAHPFVHAVEAMGWPRVPAELAPLAIDLGVLVRLRSHPSSLASPIPLVEDDALLAEEAFDELLSPSETRALFEEEAGAPHHEHHAHRPAQQLAALAERVASVTPRLDARRELERRVDAPVGEHLVEEFPRFLLEMLERLPHSEPRCLELYECIADLAEPDTVTSIEQAALVFARTTRGAGVEANARLRAALRRMAWGGHEEASALATEAFAAMSEVGDRVGACLAASVVGHQLQYEEPHESMQWLEQAVSIAREVETPRYRMVLLVELVEACGRCGNEIGQRRAWQEARVLAQSVDELGEEFGAVWAAEIELELPPEEEVDAQVRAPPPAVLREILDGIFDHGMTVGYGRLNAYLGALFEEHDRPTVLQRLAGHVDDGEADGPVEAWLCAAISELVDDDHERWSHYKSLQLRTEDRLGITPTMVRTGADDRALVVAASQASLHPRQRAVQCIGEAEDALQHGAGDRARFWAERARDYRSKMKL